MGKLQEFDIILTDNKVVYNPGDSLSGTLKITTEQPLQCKAIKVNCNGLCGVTSKTNDMDWAVEEQYFNSTVTVADKGTLKQGDHSFSFKFLIPASAPTSFEGNYGKILYRVRAYVDTPRFAKDYKTEKPFYLLRLLNLNEVPDIQDPSSSSITKTFSYMLLKTGTVVLNAQTDLKGYTPGQIIQLTVEIHNQSGKTTSTVVASLMQRVTYHTKKPTYDQRSIAEVEGPGVKADKHAEWKEQIIVPPLPQTSLSGCSLITMEYYIQVALKSAEASLTLPIYIGNVSLDKNSRIPTRASRPASTPAAMPASTPPPQPAAIPPRRPVSMIDPNPAPKPAPRARKRVSSHASPSAPPVEDQNVGPGAVVLRGAADEAFPTKNHSQIGASGPQASFSPNAFSYAPGITFTPSQRQSSSTDVTAPLSSVSTGAPIPFFSEGSAPPMPAGYPLILPPGYGTSAYPHEAPPSYDQSCNSNT